MDDQPFYTELKIRWADLDPNFHVLHSKYYDFAATCRMEYLVQHGITPAYMKKLSIGPILLREECSFRREINFGDDIRISMEVAQLTTDFSRWTFSHQIIKNGDTVSAILKAEGAWMNTDLRKMAAPPPEVIALFDAAPRSADFRFIERKSRQ